MKRIIIFKNPATNTITWTVSAAFQTVDEVLDVFACLMRSFKLDPDGEPCESITVEIDDKGKWKLNVVPEKCKGALGIIEFARQDYILQKFVMPNIAQKQVAIPTPGQISGLLAVGNRD